MHPFVFAGFGTEGDEGVFQARTHFAPADIIGLMLVDERLEWRRGLSR
jgi:hypothetical protein